MGLRDSRFYFGCFNFLTMPKKHTTELEKINLGLDLPRENPLPIRTAQLLAILESKVNEIVEYLNKHDLT